MDAVSEGLVPLGASPRNQWRVSAEAVDLRRAPPAPRPLSIAATPQRLTLDLARTAMLVIDMQNDFCHPEGWLGQIGVDVTPARTPIPVLAALLPELRRQAVPVLWVNWGNRPDRLNLSPSVLHVYKPAGTGTGLGDPLPPARAPMCWSWEAGPRPSWMNSRRSRAISASPNTACPASGTRSSTASCATSA